MAVTTPRSGRQFRVSTSTTEGGSYTLVGKMTGVTKTASTTTETTQTFEDENAYSDPGTNEVSASIDGLLLTGGLNSTVDTPEDDGLRGQSLSGQ